MLTVTERDTPMKRTNEVPEATSSILMENKREFTTRRLVGGRRMRLFAEHRAWKVSQGTRTIGPSTSAQGTSCRYRWRISLLTNLS